MKSALQIVLLTAGLMQAAPALAAAPAASPLLGSWAVDVARLPPNARPKSVTISFSEAGDAKWTTEVNVVAPDGSVSRGVATHPVNGTAAAVEGYPGADTVSVTTPAPDVLVMALSKGGVPASTRIYTVAPDGKTQTETVVYFKPDGTPAMRTNHFTRVR